MKPLVIYHANCADGFGAAFSAWTKFHESDDIDKGAEYLPFAYGEPPSIEDWHMRWAIGNRKVYILDFSFPKSTMDYLFSVCSHVTWLDHHKTAFELYGATPNAVGESYLDELDLEIPFPNVTVVLDNNRSGAMIAWKYFQPAAEVPLLIQHIDDYDRWQFKLEGTKEFNKALWSKAPWTFDQWDHIFSWGRVEVDRMCGEGAAILHAHDQNVRAVVKGAARDCVMRIQRDHNGGFSQVGPRDFGGLDNGYSTFKGLAANCPPHLASDVGHQLANQSGTYGLLWYVGKEGMTAKCSLRSNGDYDVSALAKIFGGGGHKNAAGFEVPIATLLNWIS